MAWYRCGGSPTQEKTVTPTAAGLVVTPDAGKLINKVTVNGDSDLVAGNIKKGVDIFGVTGTLKPSAPNGTSWTEINGITTSMNGLVKIGEYYVVYEDSNRVDYYAYSKDGFNWTQQPTPVGLSGVRVVNGYLYGFHSDGNNNSLKIYRNSNGSNWSEVGSITNDGFGFDSGADLFKYENGIYVLVLTKDTEVRLYYSLDGALFTLSKTITNANSTNRSCLAYGNGRWVFKAPFSAVYYSSDGKTWNTGNITSTQIDSYGNIYISLIEGVWNLWVEENLYYSNDGATWHKVTLNTGMTKSLTYYKGLRILLAANGIYYSSDGKTWTLSNITSNVSSIYNKKIEIDGKVIIDKYISTDGKEWTELPYSIKNCLRFRGKYIALSSNHVIYSNDLENWTKLLNYHSNTMLWLCNGNLILKSYAKNAKYSVDAINWIDIPNSANHPTMLVNLENGLMVSNIHGLSYSEVWQA